MARSHKYKFRRAVLILVVFVLLAGVHLAINTQNIGLKYKLTETKTKFTKLKAQNRSRAIEAAKKENLKKIEAIAKKKLDMHYPTKVNYLMDSANVSETSPKKTDH